MAGSTIVIDADNGKLDAASRKSAGEVRKIAKEAKGVGEQVNKWGSQLAAKVGGLSAILGTIRAIGQEVDRQRQQNGDANKSVGGGALGRSASIRSLGMDRGPGGAAGVDAVVRDGVGGTSVADRDALLAAMAGAGGKGKPRIKPQVAMQALTLFNSGLYSQEEIVEAAGRGENGLAKLRSQQASRFNNLSQESREELGVRQFEREKNNQAESTLSGKGKGSRVLAADTAARDASNGGLITGARNIINTVSGGLVDAGDSWMRESMVSQVKALNEISNNTRKTSRPSLAPTPDGISP